jgi:hypothetical protein
MERFYSDFRLRWWFFFFLIGLWPRLSHLKLGMLGCMAISVALPCQLCGGLSSGCLSPGFLSGVGLLEQAGSQKWYHERLVNKQSPAPLTHRANLWFRNELVSWWDYQFQLAHGFSKAVQCLAFPSGAAELPHPHLSLFSSAFCLYPPGRGKIFPPLCLATSFAQKLCNQLSSCDRIWGSLPNSVLCSPGRLTDPLGWK